MNGTTYGGCGVEGCADCRPLFDAENREIGECRHCGRRIVLDGGTWIDPEATGDDSIWRETCDSHDTFEAEHEPTEDEATESVAGFSTPTGGGS